MSARWLIGWLILGAAAAAGELPELPAVVSAKFVQIRRLRELDMTVEIRGRMISEKNGRLRWQVESPARSVTVIAADRLTHFDGETGRTATLDPARTPWLRELRECFSSWLDGDLARLRRRFDVDFPARDRLRLRPRQPDLARMYREIELEFDLKAGILTRISIHETSGDTLDIRFTEVEKDPVVPEKLWSLPSA